MIINEDQYTILHQGKVTDHAVYSETSILNNLLIQEYFLVKKWQTTMKDQSKFSIVIFANHN